MSFLLTPFTKKWDAWYLRMRFLAVQSAKCYAEVDRIDNLTACEGSERAEGRCANSGVRIYLFKYSLIQYGCHESTAICYKIWKMQKKSIKYKYISPFLFELIFVCAYNAFLN